MPSPIPDGFHSVNVHMCIKGARKAIDFYKKAFGAEEIMCMNIPGGDAVMHAELKIGDSMFMIHDETPHNPGVSAPDTLNGTSVCVCLYVSDVDAVFSRAVEAGATPVMPVSDMFWGDRYGAVTDPFGHRWEIATHQKDLTTEEVEKAAAEFFSKMGEGGPCPG